MYFKSIIVLLAIINSCLVVSENRLLGNEENGEEGNYFEGDIMGQVYTYIYCPFPKWMKF